MLNAKFMLILNIKHLIIHRSVNQMNHITLTVSGGKESLSQDYAPTL